MRDSLVENCKSLKIFVKDEAPVDTGIKLLNDRRHQGTVTESHIKPERYCCMPTAMERIKKTENRRGWREIRKCREKLCTATENPKSAQMLWK